MFSFLFLFDIDGTILNVRQNLSKQIFNNVFQRFFKVPTPKKIEFDFSGLTDLAILKNIAHLYSISFSLVILNIKQFWETLFDEFQKTLKVSDVSLLPGVRESILFLTQSNDFMLGLLTGNFQKNAYYKLALVGLDKFFPFGAFGDEEVERSKLIPKAISKANEFIGGNLFDKNNSIVIGDSVSDILSAKENDVKIIAVSTGRTRMNELLYYNPDFIIDSFYEFPKIVEFLKNEKNHHSN
ncbi:MAG: HAD family hydrolase [Candidatus Kapaibacteriales bacterium]